MAGAASSASAVQVEGVTKRFGATVALAGVDLDVAEGTVFGLLGPNGAGKTTLVRVLATLLAPDAGSARVFGHDVVHEAPAVRELLGLTGQFAAVDEILTGRENLQMFGRLFDLSPAEARQPDQRAAGALRTRRRRRPAGTHLLRRDAPPARPRVELAHASADPVPRRAHHRARSTQPQRDLGDRARARPRGDDALAHDPVPRGGRPARRPDRGDRPRAGDRAGHRQRAQGSRRRADPRGRADERRESRRGAVRPRRSGLRRPRAGRAP